MEWEENQDQLKLAINRRNKRLGLKMEDQDAGRFLLEWRALDRAYSTA